MIFYFSGTGNSLYVAKNIATNQQQTLISIGECSRENKFEVTLSQGEMVGFVFPVYFYGVPTIVDDFIQKLKINGYQSDTYTFTVFTCGGAAGNAMNLFKHILKRNHFHLNSGFTVLMPDNYIIMFNLLTPEEKRKKMLTEAESQIERVNSSISERLKNFYILTKGAVPQFMTFVNYPIYKHGRKTKPFHTTTDCIGCGLCEKICPCSMIHLVDKIPVWDDGKCTQCLACVHRCPTKAIQYGKKTYNRGRYVNPNCKF